MWKQLFACTIVVLSIPAAIAGDDPTGRAGRVSFLSGTVSIQPAGIDEWMAAEMNRPLATGDRMWTEKESRGEVDLGAAILRFDAATNSSFLNIDDHIVQLEVTMGVLHVRLRTLDEGDSFEVDTPQLAFSLLRPGEYRIEVSETGDATVVLVRSGAAEATSNGEAIAISSGQRMRMAGVDQTTVERSDALANDEFDNWCAARDQRDDHSVSARYASRDIPGIADLDDNGIWRDTPEYGEMWVPNVVTEGWAPYQTGHWAWVAPWGWTWVDEASWGYAPFHYGRWTFAAGTWGWVPGSRHGRAYFAPAMVAWMGGPGFGVGLGIGPAIGWVPLAPGEVWVPAYGVSERYFTRVNQTNTIASPTHLSSTYLISRVNKTTGSAKYLNQNAPRGVTVVPRGTVTGGGSVSKSAVRNVTGTTVASTPWQHTPPATPQHAAVLGGRTSTTAAPPAQVRDRPVMAKATPPPARVPFSQQQASLAANPGRPLTGSAMKTLQAGNTLSASNHVRSATIARPTPTPVGVAARLATGDTTNATANHSLSATSPTHSNNSAASTAGKTTPGSGTGRSNAYVSSNAGNPPTASASSNSSKSVQSRTTRAQTQVSTAPSQPSNQTPRPAAKVPSNPAPRAAAPAPARPSVPARTYTPKMPTYRP